MSLGSPLVRALVEKPSKLPLQSLLEERGAKMLAQDARFKTFFSKYKVPIGIEVEVEGFRAMSWPRTVYWQTDRDGSLKDQGMELISVPVAGRNIDYALLELEKAFAEQSPRWSHRCSVHVHINVRNWKLSQLTSLIGTYAVFEHLFFSLVPSYRKATGYAYPLTDIAPEQVSIGYEDHKYAALNVGTCIKDYGTVEFRHMEGTADRNTLRRWIQLIVKLHDFVKKADPALLKARILTLNTNSEYELFLREVFGQTAVIFPDTVLQRAMEDGVTWAKLFLGAD